MRISVQSSLVALRNRPRTNPALPCRGEGISSLRDLHGRPRALPMLPALRALPYPTAPSCFTVSIIAMMFSTGVPAWMLWQEQTM